MSSEIRNDVLRHDADENIGVNPSANESFAEVVNASRRNFLTHSAMATAIAATGVPMISSYSRGAHAQSATPPALGTFTFSSVPMTPVRDTIVVPGGYVATVLIAWGDPVSSGPQFKQDGSNTADEQLQQWGMHNDGMHFFPLERRAFAGIRLPSSTRGLLVSNHEYVDHGLLFPDGSANWSAEKVRKSQAAHGVGVIEISREGGRWTVVRPSPYARRISAATPMALSGPAVGSALVRTSADATGNRVLGTINNCSHGYTPWGTFLTGEENFNGYFVNRGTITADERRYGITATGAGYRWHEFDSRFDTAREPNEANRFGYVVEIDPFDPNSTPIKRTALGRFKHEGATVTLARDNRVVVYLGDDERFEYMYKFVSRDRFDPNNRAGNLTLLDNGKLYVARFAADGSGEWLELSPGVNGLTAAAGFPDQASICVRTRQAADVAGATKMDRPEWVAVNPLNKEVYLALTNNSNRGTGTNPGVDAANPRVNNTFGHIVRWVEAGQDPASLRFAWNIFVQAGDPANTDPNKRGNIRGDIFGSPDGLWFDDRGVLWIQTDVSTSTLGRGDYVNMGNNQMLAANTQTGEIRRFLIGPNGCEVTGVVTTPNGRTMFVNIQHPGEAPSENADPNNPTAISTWPDGPGRAGRPRSATVVIERTDGGIIGS
jgi:secreted PhoX family phosphatase